MRARHLLAIVLACAACSASSRSPADAGSSDGGPPSPDGGSPSPNAKPKLGAQIDRMGRPLVALALADPFDPDPTQQAQLLARYGTDSTPTQWAADWQERFSSNLAVWDGLDGACGNQLDAGPTAVPGRYDALAATLADDELSLDTDQATCTHYLAVELGLDGPPDNDCGGRTPLEDVVDITYSLFAAGVTSGLSDGVAQDGDHPPNTTTFPFLGEPN